MAVTSQSEAETDLEGEIVEFVSVEIVKFVSVSSSERGDLSAKSVLNVLTLFGLGVCGKISKTV